MTEEQAIALFDTKWWENEPARDIVSFQLFEPRLCMPFGDFQDAVEKSLGRPVFTHEFGLNYEGLKQEFLGEKQAPTPEEIFNLIPEAKRILVVI
jgi:hypothetical protein